jgi:hypothetical protein
MEQLAMLAGIRRGRKLHETWKWGHPDSPLKKIINFLGEGCARLARPFTYNDPFSNKLQFMGRAQVLYFESKALPRRELESQVPDRMPESGLVTNELYEKIGCDKVEARGYYKSTKIREVTFVVDYRAGSNFIEVAYSVGAIQGCDSLIYSRYRFAMVIGMVSELAEGAFIVDLDQLHKQQSLDHENPKLPCMTMKEIMQNINKDDMTLTRHAEIFKNAWF